MSKKLVDAIYVDNPDTLETFCESQEYVFNCRGCGKESKKVFRKGQIDSYKLLLCKRCKTKKTSLEKYGVECPFQSEKVKEKIRESNFNHFGVYYSLQSDEVRKKCYETNMKNLGVAHPAQSEIVRQKMQNTTLERFGVKHVAQSSDVKAKMAATNMERYGVEHYSSTDECKEKVRSTLEKRYNVSNAHFLYKKVELDGILFDSSWELAFYLYHRDNGFNIKRCERSFDYVYENENHKYFPDFEVNGTLYEIKGDQFFNKDGTMRCPFDESKSPFFEAKHQCGLKNGVHFISKDEIKTYLDFARRNYGKTYLGMSFR